MKVIFYISQSKHHSQKVELECPSKPHSQINTIPPTCTHKNTNGARTLAAVQIGPDLTDVTAVLLFCRVETPGNQTLSVSTDTVTDPISTECSERPEKKIKGRGESEREGEEEVKGREIDAEESWRE